MRQRHKRRWWVALCGLFCALFFTGSASALTVTGGDTTHQLQVYQTLCSQVDLLADVQDVWPDLYVRVNYGGHAWDGFFDCNVRLSGLAFTEHVAHEFCHEYQLAYDAIGAGMGQAWLDELTARGYGPEMWVWEVEPYYMGRANPWEAFAENMRRAYFPAYSVRQYPNTVLAWLSPADMRAFIEGVAP